MILIESLPSRVPKLESLIQNKVSQRTLATLRDRDIKY